MLTLELCREVRHGDFGTEPWSFPSVAEVSTFDRGVVSSIDGDVAPDLVPQTSTIEWEDVEGLPIDLSEVDGKVLLFPLGDELVGELGVSVESVALADFIPFEGLDDFPFFVDEEFLLDELLVGGDDGGLIRALTECAVLD